MGRKFLFRMILSLLFVAMGGGYLYSQELLVNCDYNSSTEGYGTTKFSNYAGAYTYATTNGKTSATIVIEKTNTLSGNCFDNNHKNYLKLAVVIKDGATMGNAASKWDMTYPVTVEPGGTLTCARPATASVSYIHIKNKLIVGTKGSTKKAVVDFLSDTYQDCDISIRYNGSIEVYNADFKVQDLDAQGKLTIEDSKVEVDGAFASATFFATTLTNTEMVVNGNQISGGLSDFSGGDSNQLGNVKLNNSTLTIKEGDTKVAATVTATNSTIAVNNLTVNKTLNLNEGSTLEAENITTASTGSVKIDGVQAPVVDGAIIVPVADFAALKAAVEAGKNVQLTADITTSAAITTSGVTSVIDLKGKTLTIGAGDNKFNDESNITIKNGTVSITGVTVGGNAIFCLDEYEKTLVTTMTLENVTLVGNGYSSAYGVFYIGNSSVLNVNGGEWDLKNDTHTSGGVFKADASGATLNIKGLNLTAHNVRRVVTYAATTIENSTMAISGDADGVDAQMEHGFNRSPLAITNSTITMKDMVGRGITAQNGAVTISDNSKVEMTNCQEATIDVRGNQTVTIDNTSTVSLDKAPTVASGSAINGTVQLPPMGNDFTGYTRGDAIWGEVWGNARESFVIKVLDANGNVMGTTSLNNVNGIIDGDVNVTWSLKLDAASNTDEYWTMAWTTAPTIDNMPAKVELWVDGVKVSGGNVVLNGPDNINKIYAAVTDNTGKILAYHTNVQEAIKAAAAVTGVARTATAGTVEVLSDVTVDKWIMFSERLSIGNGNIITTPINGVTIDGNDKTLTIKSIESAGNGNRLFYDATNLNIKDLTINYVDAAANQGGIGLTAGTIENVTFNGGGNAILPGTGDITVKDCTFKTNGTSIYYEEERDNLVVTGNTFENPDNVNVIFLRGNTTFTDNIVKSGRTVNVVSGSPVVSGNNFNDVRFKVYNAATATISGNTINNLVFNETTSPAASTFANNTLSAEAQAAIDALPVMAGDGTVDNPYTIGNLAQLKAFRDEVNAGNNYQGKFVKLTADIDLNNEEWTPIATFNGVFDGNDKTISNLVVNGEGKSNQGFFGQTNNGEIKKLTINNAKVTGRLNVGVVAGTPYTSKYTNIKVTGHVEVNGMAYVGGVGGKNAYANWTDITVNVDETSYVNAYSVENGTAYRTYVGGVIGFNGEGGHTFKNISSNIKVIGSTKDVGGIFGILHYGNNAENVTFTGAVEAPADAKEVGGIAGVWHNEKGQTVTIKNAKSEGTVKVGDVSTTGSIVGGAYNADNKYEANSGSLIIDGNEAWLPCKVATKADLNVALAAAKEGDIIVMDADIDYGTDQLAIEKAITLDLGGKTLTTRNAYGGMSIKNNPTVKNGNIVHASNTAAIKVWNATAFEDLVIDVQGKGDANKTIGGIVLQSGSTTKVGSIKNVTIKGAALTNGIETYNCGDATENVIGAMENVTIDAQGTGLLISAPCGTATNCTFDGGVNGIEIWIKGNYSASLELVDCDVVGGVYAHDEFSSNPSIVNDGTLNFTADAATTGASAEDVTLEIARAEAEKVQGVLKDVMVNAKAKLNNVYYATFAEAFAAAKAGDILTLLTDLNMSEILVLDKAITLDGNGKKLTSTAGRAINVDCEGNVGIKNLTIDAKGERAINVIQKPANVTIDNVTATAANYTVNLAGSAANAVVAVKNSDLTGLNVVNVAAAGAQVTVDKTVLNCDDNSDDEKYAALALNKDAQGGSIIATEVTFNIAGDSRKATNQAENGTVTINGSTEGVEVQVAYISYGNTWYGFATIEAAIAKANDGETIEIIRDITSADKITVTKSITINGNGKTLTYTGNGAAARAIDVPSTDGVELDVTIKNLTVDCNASYCQRGINYNDDGKFTLDGVTVKGVNVTYALNLPGSADNAEITIKNSDIAGNIALNVWGENSVINAENTVFTAVDNNKDEGYAAVKLNNDGMTSAEGTVINITGGKIDVTGSDAEDTEAVSNGTSTGAINISETTVVNGKIATLVAVIRYADGNSYGFETLEAAIAKAKAGETITLLRDVTVADKTVITKSITIDGNGKKLTYTGTDRAIDVPNDANANIDVTIKNLTVVATTANRGLNYNENGKFNVEGVTVTIGENVDGYAINFPGMADNAQVTIKNSNLTSRNPLNIWGENMVINVYDSEIISVDNNSTYDYAAIQLNNEIPTVGPNGAIANGTVVNVYGGTITALNDENEPSNVVANATETGVVNISDETVVTGKVLDYVANIGGVYFGSLQAAVNAIEKHGYNSPIVIMKSFATSETATVKNGLNVTIDLNGKTITVTDNTTKNFEAIKNQGTLTIKDSSADKTGKITVTATTNSGWSRYSAVIANTVGGKLTVESGTLEHLGGTDMAYGIDNLTNGKGTYAETVINGGTIKSTYRAIRQFLNGIEAQNILTVNGGTIEGTNKSIWMQDPSAKANTGTLTVVENAQLKGDVYLYVTAGSTSWPVEVSIADAALQGESTVMTGNVPAGYELELSKGIYCVTYVVATIGDNRYETLQAAITAAGTAETTINVIANTTENITIQEGANITLEFDEDITLNGYFAPFRGNLTINGGTINNTNSGASAIEINAGVLNLNNVNIASARHAVRIDGAVTATIKGGEYKLTATSGTRHAVNVSGGAEVTIKAGTFVGPKGTTMDSGAAVNVQTGATVTIEGGDFSGGKNHTLSADGNLIVTGGTFDQDPSAYLAQGYITKYNETTSRYEVFKGVAKIENEYFASIQDAIDAAENNDVITVISDFEMDITSGVTNSSGYYVLANVANKAVVIDLNGKKVTVDVTNLPEGCKDNMLMSVFCADTDGNLTLKDSSNGNGSVSVTGGESKTVYSLVIAYGGLVNIEGGNYSVDYMPAGRGMIYGNVSDHSGADGSNVSKGVNISGGNFTLGNVGTLANGSPWILATAGSNTGKYIFVTGGTYNADILHQHWIFEVVAPTNKALKNNGNGTYTIVDAVAFVKHHEYSGYYSEIGYATLAEAFEIAETGDVVTLVTNVELENTITVNAGKDVILDLNGKTISGVCNSGQGHMFMVQNTADLTVKDSSENEEGKITYSRGTSNTGWVIDLEGDLILESGTIELTGDSWSIGYAVDVRPNSWGSEYTEATTFTMSGGKLVSSDAAVRVASSSADNHENVSANFIMNGGEIEAVWDGIFVQQSNAAYDILNVRINGGNIKSALSPLRLYGPAATSVLNNVENPITLNITGGTFDYTGDDLEDNKWLVPGVIMVSGGATFEQMLEYTDFEITGGTFEGDVNAYCAEGFAATNNDNGTWTVMPAQEQSLVKGWNWYSTYLNIKTADLTGALGSNGVQIKNQNGAKTFYVSELNGWSGSLDIDHSKMYMINVLEACSLQLAADVVDATSYDINLRKGWSWIGYPSNQEIDINTALANFEEPNEGDRIKSQYNGYAEYRWGKWRGTLKTLVPGIGYMYNNKTETVKSFRYNFTPVTTSRGTVEANVTAENNYWIPNATKYPFNMTMTAVVDGLADANYEVAAFVNGEVRGSARPIYIEEIDAYVLFLTIHGEDVEEMSFRLYDIDNDTEYDLSDRINYSNNAEVGSLDNPYTFSRGTTGIGEASMSEVNIYPNPTTTGTEINLEATSDKVEVFNALGVKVAEYQNVDTIDALETAGIYVIRITNNGNVQNCRLVVK